MRAARTLTFSWTLAGLVAALGLLWAYTALSAALPDRYPEAALDFPPATDAELIATFLDHHQDASELLTLLRHDTIPFAIGGERLGTWWKIDRGWIDGATRRTAPDRAAVLAELRIPVASDARILILLQRLRAYRVQRDGDERFAIEIGVSRTGNGRDGRSRDYVLPHTDNVPAKSGEGEVFTTLTAGWFLRTRLD